MTTLTMSNAPASASAPSESQRLRLSPNRIVHTPNPVTEMSKLRPVCAKGGQRVSAILVITAPTAGAARSSPNPDGPVCSISAANTGNSAIAPPNSTENKSSVSAERRSGSPSTKRRPPVIELRIGSSVTSRTGERWRTESNAPTAKVIRTASTA